MIASDNIELRVHEEPWNGNFSVAFFAKNGGTVYVSQPLEMRETKQGAMIEPTARLSHESMQGLFNEMWRLGFRPKDGTGNGGHIEALKYHLEDMRKLAFQKQDK